MDIAWDLDGTLVNHPASKLLHQFILATPHIRHVIVTFRSEKRHACPWSVLRQHSSVLHRGAFRAIYHMPDELMHGYSETQAARGQGMLPFLGSLLRPKHRAWDEAYRSWKGSICRQEGITALVDDLTHMVAAGCSRHGIELFHPADFLPTKAEKPRKAAAPAAG